MNFKKIIKRGLVAFGTVVLSACGVIQPYTAPVPQGKEIKDKKLLEKVENYKRVKVYSSSDYVTVQS